MPVTAALMPCSAARAVGRCRSALKKAACHTSAGCPAGTLPTARALPR
jgi:hypothetical protein